MTFAPTPEQQEVIRLALTGENLVVEAGAGAGKSSTLRLVAEALAPKRGLYLVFNKAAQTDAAARFPSNVECRTAHSLAWAPIVGADRRFDVRLHATRARSSDIARALGFYQDPAFQPYRAKGGLDQDVLLQPGYVAGLVVQAIRRFCNTADAVPGGQHVPVIEKLSRDSQAQLRRDLDPYVKKAWKDVENPNGTFPYTFDCYLKQWQLSKPVLRGFDFILFDEAQDASPVMIDLVARQTHAQLIVVGDTQQQIYEWRGAQNALQAFPRDNVAWLTQSFRFGEAVAEVANDVLGRIEGAELRITGTPSIPSEVGAVARADALLCRTNSLAVASAIAALRAGQRVALVGGADEVVRFAKGAQDLQAGKWTSHPDLTLFQNWTEVLEYVEADALGEDLARLVKLVEEYGADLIVEELGRTVPEARADLIISTCHKAKGREWDTVVIGGDFPGGEEFSESTGKQIDRDPTPEELRLLYVAVTRARLRLDISQVRLLQRV